MRSRHAAAVVATLAAGCLLAGCTSTATTPEPTSTHSVATATAEPTGAPTVDVDGFTPAPTPPANGLDNQDAGAVDPTAAPPGTLIPSGDSISPAEAAKAEMIGYSFVHAFVRKDLAGKTWEDGYMVYLTPYSQSAYAGTAQRNVPGSRVTGSAALAVEGTNTTTSATITVPTDAGMYQVQVLATNKGAWLVRRALLPGTNQ